MTGAIPGFWLLQFWSPCFSQKVETMKQHGGQNSPVLPAQNCSGLLVKLGLIKTKKYDKWEQNRLRSRRGS